MKHSWRVYFEREPRTLAHDQLQRWLSDNTEVVEADKKFLHQCGALSFADELPAAPVEPMELCGEPCTNGKPCVRRKGHAINKRWGHMPSLAPKKDQPAQLLGVRDFAPGQWVDVKIERDRDA